MAAGLATWSFRHGLVDWRFEMAGLADPFLGRPSPGTSVIVGLALTGLVMLGWRLAQRAMRRGQTTGLDRDRWPRWIAMVPIFAVWGGYALGASVVIAGGGSTEYRATMQLEFDSPLGMTASVPATCRSVVGEPGRIAEITPEADGLYRIDLRSAAGAGWAPASTGPRAFLLSNRALINDFTIPGVPDRPAPYLVVTLDDGSTRAEAPNSFLQVYDAEVTNVVDSGLSGVARMTGTRIRDRFGGNPRWVNLVIADDPWPETFGLTIRWTCRP